MNKKFFVLPLVGILILISVIFTIQNFTESDEPDLTLTGTPADNFSEEQRSKFCGTGDAKSNDYVKEYKIPTDCTLPQAVVTDYDGNIWLVESNTGNLAKFDPILESFTEFENPLWLKSAHSMMWGMDYAPDGTIQFTKEITSSADDAREIDTGNHNTKNHIKPLSLGLENGATKNIVGIRYQAVTINPGEQINSASIQFRAMESASGTANVRIYGELSADNDADAFANTKYNISDRPLTTAYVDWMNIPAWSNKEVGPDTTTPDLSVIIQEIVDDNNWNDGQDIAIIFFDHPTSGSDERRKASAVDHKSPAPTITIDHGSSEFTTIFGSGRVDALADTESLGTSVEDPPEDDPSTSEINVVSHHQVGNNWDAEFETTGADDLIITAIDGTTWTTDVSTLDEINQLTNEIISNLKLLDELKMEQDSYRDPTINADEIAQTQQLIDDLTVQHEALQSQFILETAENPIPDLRFLNITCGDQSVPYTWIDNSVVIENYSCNETGLVSSLTYTPNDHYLEFQFGSDIAIAQNSVSELLTSVDSEDPVNSNSHTSSLLTIAKSDFIDPVTAGTSLTYTITVTNPAAITETGVVITDTLPAGVTFVSASAGCAEAAGVITCGPVSIGPGGIEIVTITVDVDSSTSGTLSNTATVTSDVETPLGTSIIETTDVVSSAPLSVSKDDSSVGPVIVGDEITYKILVINPGPSDGTGIIVTDMLPPETSFVSASPGCTHVAGIVTCLPFDLTSPFPSNSAVVSPKEITVLVDPGTTAFFIINTVFVSSDTNPPVPADEVTIVIKDAPLSITKDDSIDPVTAGSSLTYTITVDNLGISTATGVTVTDTIPAGTTFVSASAGCVEAAGVVTCGPTSIPPGGSVVYTITVTVDATTTGTIFNTATATSDAPPPVSDDETTDVIELAPLGTLKIKKTVIGDIGGTFAFTVIPEITTEPNDIELTILDGDNRAMTGIETVPAVLHTITETGIQAGFALQDVVCTDEFGGPLVPEPIHLDGTDFVTVTVPEGINVVCDFINAPVAADLSLTKSVDDSTPNVGDIIVYTIIVSNAGPSDATGVLVEDLLPSGVTYVSDDGSGAYVDGTGIWTIGGITNGGSATLNITVTVDATGDYENIAQVNTANELDLDSTPDNDVPGEDDQDNEIITSYIDDIALVCDNSNCTHADKDIAVKEHLADLGYNTVQFADEDQSWNTADFPLIVISESVQSSKTLWLRNVSTPILTTEDENHDEIFGDDGSGQGQSTNITITGTPPITDNLGYIPGDTITVFTSIDKVGYMNNDLAGVAELAHFDGQSSHHLILAANAGVIHCDAGPRVFFGANYFVLLTSDGVELFDSAFNWAITPSPNDCPVAVDDSDSTDEDNAVTTNVTANDSDSDGTIDDTSVIITVPPTNGGAVQNGDGTVTYTPNPDFNGVDTYTYSVADDDATSNEATVTITINPVNDPPVADAGPDQTVTEGNTVNLTGLGSTDDSTIASYSWTIFDSDGETFTLNNANTATPSFDSPTPGSTKTYVFELTVTDDGAPVLQDTDQVSITTNKPTPGSGNFDTKCCH